MAKIIYDYYDGVDLYSDDIVEEKLLKFYSANNDDYTGNIELKEDELLQFYHMSPMRKGLLAWYDFKPNSVVVEVGGGCGALTGLLCEKCKKVITIELSKRRAEIILNRCKKYDNLEIYVANISSVCDIISADYVVAVGVLEYQKSYSSGVNPYICFLKEVKKILNNKGKLLLAIENRLGIKFMVGAPEDHTCIPFDGVSDYRHGGKAKTFSKADLNSLLVKAGFNFNYFYFPMPDYRISTEIYSEDYMPTDEWGLNIVPYYGEYIDSLMCVEKNLYKDLFRNKVFGEFANSFLVEAGIDEERFCDVIYSKVSYDRHKDFRICTRIHSDGKVTKENLENHINKNLLCCVESANAINSRKSEKICAIPVKEISNGIEMTYCDKKSLLHSLLNAIEYNEYDEVVKLLDIYYCAILEASDVVEYSSKYGPIMDILYMELTLGNCFIDERKRIIAFDLETKEEKKPANFLMFRAIEYLESISKGYFWSFDFRKIKEKYGLFYLWDEYLSDLNTYYNKVFNNPMNVPLINAQVIDIDRMELNKKFISGLGMDLLKIQDEYEYLIHEDENKTRDLVNNQSGNIEVLKSKIERYLTDLDIDVNKHTLVPWGTGGCFRRNIDLIAKLIPVKYVCDSKSSKWESVFENGIVCKSPEEIDKLEDVVFLIMVDNRNVSFDIVSRIQKMNNKKCIHIANVIECLIS